MDSTITLGIDSLEEESAFDSKFRERGASLMQQGRFGEAADFLQKAVNSDSNDEVSWRLLGGALASKGDYVGAVPAFERAVFLAPANARNFYNLGVALQGVGRDSEARSALEKSIRIDPTYQQARTRMESLNRASQGATAAVPVTPIGSSPLTTSELGSIGFSPGNPNPPSQPADVPVVSPPPLAAHTGGMAGLSSLGSVGGSPIEAVPASAPSSAAPMLRQPISGPTAASSVGSIYNPSHSYGGYGSDVAPQPVLGQQPGSWGNSSGTLGDCPPEVARGFNLGAAVITFWWLRNHNLRPLSLGLAGFYFVLRMLYTTTHSWVAEGILVLAQIAVFFVMGFMGNRLGWQNRRFDDIEDFKSCQRKWMYWAIPLIVLQAAGLISLLVMIGSNL